MKMTLAGHLRELRGRIIWSLLFFIVMFLVGFVVVPVIKEIVILPLKTAIENPSLIMTGIEDGLVIEFSVAGLFAIFASAPFLLWQLWRYIQPALKKGERKIAIPIIIASPILFVGGAMFAYYILLPIMFNFFVALTGEGINMMPNMRDYMAFSIGLLRMFGFAFQFPLILIILNRTGVLSRKQILSAGSYIIITIFILAAVLTPPDIISQIALALPLLVLFALSFLFMKE